MDLDLVRLRYSIEDISNYKYRFTLSRKGHSFEFSCADLDSKEGWMKDLSRYCILSEFNNRYDIIELIGKGSMGEVHLF